MAKKSIKIKTNINKKDVKTSRDLFLFTEQHPKLSVAKRVQLVDNLPELEKKIDELREFYNNCLNEAGVWRQSGTKVDKYNDARSNEQREYPSASIINSLWFN